MKKISDSSKIKKPLVSVIMNCHNGEKFLKASIKSLKSQTYKNWELVFWDNNSSDNSKKILKRFQDKRIKYFFSKKKLNLYQARNIAIMKAKGKYVSFLDTDDLWKKNKIYTQVNYLENNNKFVMAYSNYFNLYGKKKILKYNKVLPEGYIFPNIIKNYCIGIVTVMVKRIVFSKFNFNNSFNIIGDFDFFIRLSQRYKIGYLNQPLALYRIHDKNLSNKKLSLYIKELNYWILINKKKLISFSNFVKFKYFVLKLIFKKYFYILRGV